MPTPENFDIKFVSDAQVADQNNRKDSDSFSAVDFESRKEANNNEGEENTVKKIDSPNQNLSRSSSSDRKKRPATTPIKIVVSQQFIQAPTINYVRDGDYNVRALSQPSQLKFLNENSMPELIQQTVSKLGSLTPVYDPEGISNIVSVDMPSGNGKRNSNSTSQSKS